jgi:D-arabinose 1-dehydrogenase-like Zn-dependent alcohol dehydrogenase
MSAPTTGRAVVARSVGGPLELEERPVPTPGPGEALVRIEACGVCGSDLFLLKGGFGPDKFPVVPGHEACGVIAAVGEGVTTHAVGDQVAIYYIENDPSSPYVRAGRPNLGPGVRRMGVDCDGAFADYVVRPVETLIRPSAPVDPVSLAVLTDAVATPYHALTAVAGVQPGEHLVVIGIGGLGSNAVQIGRHLGAEVTAVARSRAKLELAEDLGAHHLVAAAADVAGEVRRITGDGAQVVLQCVGSAAQDQLAIDLAGPGGRVVFVGAALESFSIRAVDLIWRELSLLGSRGFTPDEIAAVVDLHLAGVLRTDHMLGTTRPLEEAEAALDDLRAGRVLRSVLVTS